MTDENAETDDARQLPTRSFNSMIRERYGEVPALLNETSPSFSGGKEQMRISLSSAEGRCFSTIVQHEKR